MTLTFEQWFRLVDLSVQSKTHGISVHDLADFCSRDLFDDGVSPDEAADEALEGDDLACMFVD